MTTHQVTVDATDLDWSKHSAGDMAEFEGDGTEQGTERWILSRVEIVEDW